MPRLRIHPEIRQRSRELRHPLAPAEKILWEALRQRRLDGIKFRRQHPIGPYIVDFYCAMARLVIELDGASHVGQEEYDAERSAWLEAQGYFVIRFKNEAVVERLEGVLREIGVMCQSRIEERGEKK